MNRAANTANSSTNSPRQAIVTKYHGPTNSRGSRVSAKAEAGRKFYTWDDSLGSYENHRQAALLFADAYGWHGEWIGGGTADGYVFTCQDFRSAGPTWTVAPGRTLVCDGVEVCSLARDTGHSGFGPHTVDVLTREIARRLDGVDVKALAKADLATE